MKHVFALDRAFFGARQLREIKSSGQWESSLQTTAPQMKMDVGGDGFSSPETDLSRHLKNFFTWVAVRIVLAQLRELGSWETHAELHHFAETHSLKDGDSFINQLMTEHQELALRVLKVRELYPKEEFEWGKCKKLVVDDMREANLRIMREYLYKTSLLPSASKPTDTNDPS